MHRIVIDFETYYDADYSLKKMTPAEYINHPKFLCNGAAIKLDDRPTRFIDPDQLPGLFKALPTDAMMISHNMLFDGLIAHWKYDYRPRLYVDTLGMARATLPRRRTYSLGALAEYFGLPRKDETLLSRVKGMDLPSIRAAGLYLDYSIYAAIDADICRGIYDRLIPGFPATELVIMDMVLRCAIEPRFEINRTLLHEHAAMVAADKAQLLREAGLANRADLMSQDRFAELLSTFGVIPPRKISAKTGQEAWSFSKTDSAFMALKEHPDPRVQALVAARLGSRSTLEETRTQSFIAISKVCEHMPVPLRFSGAHTHRLSGEWGINMQNLPRGGKLRSALIAPDGYQVVSGDAAQIEARIVAWLANAEEMLDDFALGIDVYAKFAGRIAGFPDDVTAETHPKERFIGKTAVLGLGYGLGHTKFADRILTSSVGTLGYKVELNENEAREVVMTYRRVYAQIPVLWSVLGGLGVEAMLGEVPTSQIGPLEFDRERVRLPSGLSLWYEGMSRDSANGEPQFFNPHYQSMEKLWGGKLLENVVQALARIVIMDASLRILKRTGERFVMQVHDELVYLVPNEFVEPVRGIIKEEMCRPPSWARNLPLDAKVGTGKTYGDAK